MKQTKQAVRAIKLSILDVYEFTTWHYQLDPLAQAQISNVSVL
jgi:hypothetical protein